MSYILPLLFGLILWSSTIDEVVLLPNEVTLKVGESVVIEAKAVYGDSLLDIPIAWKTEGDGQIKILPIAENRIKVFAEKPGIISLCGTYQNFKGFGVITINENY